MMTLITKLISFTTALVCTVVPFISYSAEKPDEILFNVALR